MPHDSVTTASAAGFLSGFFSGLLSGLQSGFESGFRAGLRVNPRSRTRRAHGEALGDALRSAIILGLGIGWLAAPASAAAPPMPSTPTASCDATVSGLCYNDGTFTVSTSSPGAHHYRLCRSNDTTGWGGCNAVINWNGGSTMTVSGSNLPSDGFRRAYYVSACDAASQCTNWAPTPVYVRRDTSGPGAPGNTSVPCSYTQSDNCWVTGNFTASVSPAFDGGSGVASYQVCRSHDVAGGWAGCNVSMTLNAGTSFSVSGSNLPANGSRRAYYFRAKDRVGNWGGWNGPRYVRVDRNEPTVSATGSSSAWQSSATAIVQAADAVGGASANSGLRWVRYRWDTPLHWSCADGTAINAGSSLAAPAGDHRLYLCARDNTGRIAHWNGRYKVDSTAPAAPGPTTVSCAYTSGDNCWVTGAFAMTVTPATDNESGIDRYHICRSNDSTGGWAGCHVSLTLFGGTAYVPSGSQLPADGMRRAYRFQARNHAGAWGAWNTPRYVRVDRHDPTVSAAGASNQWFDERLATIISADDTGGAAANSGLATTRARWNQPLDSACTQGFAAGSGTVLSAPEGDNTLYVCARDRTGRVKHWNGTYRVDSGPPTAPGPTTVACDHTSGGACWVRGSFVASVTPATDGGVGVDGYRICRSRDVPSGFGGCQVDMVPLGSGGTSFTVSGGNLPIDGHWRSYWFAAIDAQGNWGPWNAPRYVRVDRHAPTVSASGASSQWFTSRTATVSAADTTGGAGANSGLAEVRYRWNAALNGACTNGATVSVGGTLTAPEGDGTLYLCARDNTGRVGTWNGSYRVDNANPTTDTLTTSASFWSIGDGSTYQITARATDSGSGIRELRTLINYQGSNNTNRRGFFSWRDQSLGYQWSTDRVACTGGGFASKHPTNYNPHTVTLVGCSTSLSGGQRTVVFTVRPEASFGTFGAINDVSMWARDFLLNRSGWRNFDVNFATGALPPAQIRVRDFDNTWLAPGDTADWGTLEAGGGLIWRTIKVRNVAPAGSGNLVLEHSPSNITVTGSSAFTIGGTLNSPLAVGQQDTFVVRLDSNQAGTHTGVLSIWHNDPAQPNPFTVNLRGTITGAPTVSRVDGGPVRKGQIKTLTIRGANLSGGTIEIAPLPSDDGNTPASAYPTATLTSINAAGTRMDVRVDATANGVEGFYYLDIDTPGGATAAQFRVVGAAPVVDVWTPSEPIVGRVHVVSVIGENLAGANLVPMNAGVKILDLDNSNSKSLSGLMYVSNSVPPGEIDLRVDGTGGSTMLPMELRPEIRSATKGTRLLSTDGGGSGGPSPQIVIQDPISVFGPQPGMDEHPRDLSKSASREEIDSKSCFSVGGGFSFNISLILVNLVDELGDPLVQEAINALLPNTTLDFTSLTFGLQVSFSLEFSFSRCGYDHVSFTFCVRGSFRFMVPLIGGWMAQFDSCLGTDFGQELPGSGFVSNHAYNSNNPCVEVEDLELPSEPNHRAGERRGRIRVNCCENANVSLQTSGEVFGAPFSGEGPIIEAELECAAPEEFSLRIEDVSFKNDFGDLGFTIKRDEQGAALSAMDIQDPEWSDSNLDGTPDVAENGIAYVRGRTIKVVANLRVDGAPQTPSNVRIRATSADGITLESALVSTNSLNNPIELNATNPLPSTTKKFAPLVLDWTCETSDGQVLEIGTTRHRLYVTLRPPVAQTIVTMTALELGIGDAGATNATGVLHETWQHFASTNTAIPSPADVKAWDNRRLVYYPSNVPAGQCAQSSLPLLSSGAGQCKGFVLLMRDALAVNGVTSEIFRIAHRENPGPLAQANDVDMVIKNWTLHAPSFPGEEYPYHLCWDGGAITNRRYCDLTSVDGVRGQNNETPSSKIFRKHYVLTSSEAGGLLGYLDPSYGISFQFEGNFQLIAIEGYARTVSSPGGDRYGFRPAIVGENELVFTQDTDE